MIKLETAHIEDIRGIRKLDIDFKQRTFAISGENGTGKSGVIDAIEFGLTGQISRLTGPGTKGLTLSEHGPHVDRTKFPDAAYVTLKVYLPELKKSATIMRRIKAPKEATIFPDDADVKAVLSEIADHPEITLTRRDILRFILVEPTKRSEEIQTLLKLDQIGDTRNALNAAANRLQNISKAATAMVHSSRETLRVQLQLQALNAADILGAVNKRRDTLDLEPIAELTADVKIDAGVEALAAIVAFNKASSLRHLEEIAKVDAGQLAARPVGEIAGQLERLEQDPALLLLLQQRAFLEAGFQLAVGPECPLCDTAWDGNELRAHIKEKIDKSVEAKAIQQNLLSNGSTTAGELERLDGLLRPLVGIAADLKAPDFAEAVTEWRGSIGALKTKLATVDGILALKETLSAGWLSTPPTFYSRLVEATQLVRALPDQSVAADAHSYLKTGQLRLDDYREARRKEVAAQAAAACAKRAHEVYCEVRDRELGALYDDVQKDFSAYYRAINGDDEDKFTAKLTPTDGRLELDVNFYERGLFPPGAYHSEGHQDGMGVCLYLALMKRLFGQRFLFSLLDDVVMSVDTGHRYKFCRLLKEEFPETQFVLTTHDKLWASQMRSAGLVDTDSWLAFHSWTVDTGPLVESGQEVWLEVEEFLSKGKVDKAGAALRHHLEYVSRHLADLLGATPQFRSDGDYDLGEILPSVLSRLTKHYGAAASAAQSWQNAAAHQDALDRKAKFVEAMAASQVEQWAVNKAVHYNAWTANFSRKDFEPVVAAFKTLLLQMRCDGCGAWLYIMPKRSPEALRCGCGAVNLNLKKK